MLVGMNGHMCNSWLYSDQNTCTFHAGRQLVVNQNLPSFVVKIIILFCES